ncbi:MAG: proprotein convertase P-domain-containing protein [Acidobacteria bacterium]|nr:proprotein convertase P-domain-containing protein [Acidobacteriota bacterium]
MAMRIGGDNSVNQLQQTVNNSSSTRTTQQPSVGENSAFQGDQLRAGTSNAASIRNQESGIAASSLRNQAQSAPSLRTVVDNIDSAMRSVNSGRDGLTATGTASPNAAIRDNSTTTSAININDDLSVTGVNVAVNIDHTYVGDVEVKLKSPSGKEVTLRAASGGRGTGTLNFTANPADFNGESSKGAWTLVVNDKAAQDTGTLKSWNLSVSGDPKTPAPGGDVITKNATPNAAIRDNSTITSAINIADEGSLEDLKVNVNIGHTYRGDLVVKLVSPSGKEAVLTNKAGGSADNFVLSDKSLTEFAGESIKGDWKLVVQDTATQDTGTLNSWGLSIKKKAGGTTPPPPQPSGPTLLQVTGDANFRSVVARDLAKFAPGTTVDSQGYVRAATTRTPGHEQGYKLLDDILAGGKGGNKKVNISFTSQNAFTQSGAGATVVNGVAGTGSNATVAMDFDLRISLPALQPDGTIKDEPIATEIILAHELAHASHAQNGTIDRSLRDRTFTDGSTTYKENWRYEEFRTTGFTGFRQGNEPSENSIRAELGYNARATYLDRSSWTRVNGATNNGITANAPTNGNEQLVGDSWRSAGAVLPNGQFRICDCFAC